MRTKKYCFLLVRNVISSWAVFCLLFLSFSLALKAQDQAETGLPFITNYSPKTFNALPQTWCVQEDESGIMYFGIQNYILEYDGVKWRKISLPLVTSASVVRAMAKNKEGTIYYGGFGDIGYLAQDSLGQTKAKSLLNLIPAAHRNFLDIWSAYATESGIYFQAREYIFRLDDKAGKGNEKTPVKVWLPKTKFMYSFYLDGNYYVHQQGLGLFKMVNDSLVLIPGSEFLGKERMQVMMPYKTTTNEKQYLIGLFYTGLYLFDGTNFHPFASKADQVIKSGSILYKGLQLKNGNYVLSTTGKGLVIMDPQGNMLQRINRDVGLQDESIYSAFEDKKGALWLSLDNGISRVEIGSPLTKFGLQSGINTGVLTIKRFEEKIFIGTTNGILKFNKEKAFFDPVNGVPQNQIFSLVIDGNELLVPGDGLFAIKNDQTFSIRKSISADLTLSALALPAKNPNLLLGGGTFGVAIFQRNGDSLSKTDRTWHFQGYIHGITDQIWSFAENADGTLWAGTQNGFAYRVRLSTDDKGNVDPGKTTFVKYGPEQGLRNALGQVYSIKGTNYFIADSGLYVFNEKLNRFIPDSTFGTFKNGGGNSQFDMVEDYLGRVWIRFGKETRLMVPKPEGGYRIEKTHLDAVNELTIQKIYPEKNGIVWLCTTDGLIRYDENREKNYDQTYKTVLRQVSAGKEILNPNISGETKRSSVSYNNSTLRFEYAAPFFEQEDKTKYQTWLEGFEKGWSDWDNNYYKEYTNLPDGKYTFHVRALNIYEKISDEAVYSFEILPPWYRTWWAYLLYALIAISLIGLIIRWRTRQLHEKHRELEKVVAERTAELSHRVEELAVINSVQDGLVREMNMQGIYELVGEKIREIFHAQVIDIATYDKTTNLMEDHYAYEKGDRTLVGSWEPYGFRKIVVESGQLLLINHDLANKSVEFGSKVIHGEQPKSAVWVPMVRGNEVKGMISLQDLDKEYAFTDSDVSLLTTLANSMTVALESARRFDETTRLLKETDQRNAELAVINSVQEGLVREMEMQGIYDLVGEKMREIFDAQVIDIVTYDSKTNLIEDRYSYEKGDRTLVGAREPMGFRKRVIETRKPIFINENLAEHMQVTDNPVLVGEAPKSIVFVPMMSGNELKGIISLQNVDHEHAFSNSDLSLLTTLANSMSVALESARLFDETNRLLKETEQRTAELAVINSVQDGLAKEMDMQGIYNLVGTRVQELFNAQVVMIATFDYDKKLEYFNYHIEKGEVSIPAPRKYDKLREHLIKTKQKILINKNTEETAAEFGLRVVPGTEFPKSLLFVPLVSGDKVKSYVSLQNIDRENAFSESDVRLLETLANSMSVALENARLFDETNRLLKETEQRTSELAIINSVQAGLASKLNMQAIYELIGEKIREVFNVQVVDIVTYDPATNLLSMPYAYEKGDRSVIAPIEPYGFRQHVINSRKPLLINHNVKEAMAEYNNPVLVGEETKSNLFVPLLVDEQVKGIISLQDLDHEYAFSDSDVRLLQTLANSMSVALENARLFDETNRLLKETEQRTAELAVINSVQEGLSKELEMQAIYELVGNKIQEVFDAQAVVIASLDQRTGYEHFLVNIEKGKYFHPKPRKYDKLREELINTKQKIVINKHSKEISAQYGLKVVEGTEMPKSLVFVPLSSGGKITSYISLQSIEKEDAFSPADIRLLETLANSMSVALENARLFDETNRLLKETEQRTAELAVINSVQDGLAKELDMQAIYDLVGERIRHVFDAQVVLISTFNHEAGVEEFKYLIENKERFYPEPRPLNKLRKHLVRTRQKIVINTEAEGIKEYDMTAIPGTKSVKSAVFVPLIIGDKITSYISLQNVDREYAFSKSDIRLLETLSNSMSVALENARLFDETNRLLKETEQRTGELAVINSVQDGLAKELDMQGIYNLVGDRVQHLFNAQAVIIATFDLENQKEYFNYVFENNQKVKLESRPINKLRRLLIDKKRSIYISTIEQASKEYGLSAIEGTAMPHSMVFVPLLSGNVIKGYVSLQNIDKENAFSESDIRLLETLSNSMSVALENARLFDETNRLLKETEQRTAELAVINSVQQGLAKEMDIQAIYDMVGDRIRELFDAQVVLIATLDQEEGVERFKYIIEKGKRYYHDFRKYDKLRQHLVRAKEKIVINENYEQAVSMFGMKTAPGTESPKSCVFVPLIITGKVNSYVSLQNVDKENAFSESDVRLLETLANSMSVALENARLFDETNRLLKETEQRTSELAIINSVQEGLASKLDIQSIYDLVGDKIRDVFDTQGISISFYDRRKNFITHPYYLYKGKRVNELGFELGKGLTSHIIQTGQPLLINENAAQRFKELGAVFAASETTDAVKSWVGVPLISGGQVNGTIRLENYEREYAYSESDLSLLQTLANSMSVALENARLFDETNRLLKETEQRKAELAVINNVQEGLVKEFKSEDIYELVGERLVQLFDTQSVLIRTFDHENGTENWRYAIEKGQRQFSEPRPMIWANKRLIETHQPILINENYLETARKYGGSGVSMGKPPKSAVFVPMIVGDVVRGSVSLQNVDKENAFNESDMGLLTTLTNSMGVALENARLFDETTFLLADAKQRAAELSTVNSISKALASQLDADDLIKLVGDQLKDLFKANIVYLAMLNKKTKTIHFPYQYGDDMRPIKLGEGLTSKIIITGEPLLINRDKDVSELTNQLGVKRVGLRAASYLGVPIPVGDEIIGVLSVQSTEHENSFKENDLRLLSTIASSVGVALRNATLFEDVKLAKLEAETASKLAEKANEAKSAFLSTVSHELRTPLTSVLGFAKIIKKRLEEKIFPIVSHDDPKIEKTINQVSENLHVVISEGERLTHLINDVLDLAKIEAGKMEWNQENVSMAEVAERAISATSALFDQKTLELVKHIDTNLPDIIGDRDKLIQVVINLISNAVKFTPKGAVTCRVFQEKDEIIVSITDTGIGIAPEDYGAVFEQFKQVGGDTLTDKPKGTGLGLPICKEIVEYHGGRIWLDSTVGKGSTFSFALPIIAKTAIAKPVHLNDLVKQLKEQMAQSQFNVIGKHATILVVDDDDSIRSLLHQELSDAGYLIEEATNGKEALECIRKNRPDLIILDVMMPEMNGFDVAAILKNDPNTMDIPIIVLSIVQDKARGFRIGVDRYLTKPIDTAQLFTEVGALLEQGKSKKKVMVVDEDINAIKSLSDVLHAKGYHVVESDGKELVANAIANQPDIIILNSVLSDNHEIVQSLRFEKGLENVLFLIYQ